MITERGLQTKICKQTGLNKSIVSRYFNSKYIGNLHKKIIDECLSKMGRNHLKNPDVPVNDINSVKWAKRTDILNNLPYGGGRIIAEKCGCSESRVSMVLNGRMTDDNDISTAIIVCAETLSAINIWKTRFCKFESML